MNMYAQKGPRPVRGQTPWAPAGTLACQTSNGSSIMEVLIAAAVFSLTLGAVLMLSTAGQTYRLDSDTTQSAIYDARDLLEDARADAEENYLATVTTASTTPAGLPCSASDLYCRKLTVADLTPCKKEATSRVLWSTNPNRPQSIKLASQFVSTEIAQLLGSDCATDGAGEGWTKPDSLDYIDLGNGVPATGVDVEDVGNKRYAFVSSLGDTPSSKHDFFVINATDRKNIILLGSEDFGEGLNDVAAFIDDSSGEMYAAVANNDITEQLKILHIELGEEAATSTIAANVDLLQVPLGTNSEAQTIFYYDEKIYVGTNYLASPPLTPTRPEFQIVDVSTPSGASVIGTFDVQHNVNDIMVQGDYAYLATSDPSGELWVLNIANPGSITFAGKYDAADGITESEDGTAVYVLGGKVYLGRKNTPSSRPDFLILDATTPASITLLGSKYLNMNPSSAIVSAIYVSGKYAFLGTSDSGEEFKVFDISNPADIRIVREDFNFSQEASGIDFGGDYIYVSVRAQNALRVIRPAQCSDKLDSEDLLGGTGTLDGFIDRDDPQCVTGGVYDPEDDSE